MDYQEQMSKRGARIYTHWSSVQDRHAAERQALEREQHKAREDLIQKQLAELDPIMIANRTIQAFANVRQEIEWLRQAAARGVPPDLASESPTAAEKH